jgi:probable aminopeptidase NPEPL1
MTTHIHLPAHLSRELLEDATAVAVIGRASRLAAVADVPAMLGVDAASWAAMLDRTKAGDGGASAVTWVGRRKIVMGVLPEPCSRHNSPSRAWAVPAISAKVRGEDKAVVVHLLGDEADATAVMLATARALPLFNRKSDEDKERHVHILALAQDGPVHPAGVGAAIDGVRLAARLVDMPTNELHTDAFVDEAQAVADRHGAVCTVIRGTDLRDQGFGGLWGVGKAATRGPALVVLEHRPAKPTAHVAWVGKGVVYDTGGLSLKGKDHMPGMKGDMGGAAAVLGAFQAAVAQDVDYGITALLCLAENAIGPDAQRPDDIVTLRSGKTVELNNTDAEGRLVLADGVAYATERGKPDLLVDMATLTGAALVATGKVHAALYCNDEAVEQATIRAGRGVGEPAHALPYAPELYRKEFKSNVADMKNSVKDRGNAQSSCAGQFVGNHLPEDAPRWLHVDIAGTAWDSDNRGTGFGVGLLLALGSGPQA